MREDPSQTVNSDGGNLLNVSVPPAVVLSFFIVYDILIYFLEVSYPLASIQGRPRSDVQAEERFPVEARKFHPSSIPLQFKIMVALRILGRDSVADDIEELSGVDESTTPHPNPNPNLLRRLRSFSHRRRPNSMHGSTKCTGPSVSLEPWAQ